MPNHQMKLLTKNIVESLPDLQFKAGLVDERVRTTRGFLLIPKGALGGFRYLNEEIVNLAKDTEGNTTTSEFVILELHDSLGDDIHHAWMWITSHNDDLALHLVGMQTVGSKPIPHYEQYEYRIDDNGAAQIVGLSLSGSGIGNKFPKMYLNPEIL